MNDNIEISFNEDEKTVLNPEIKIENFSIGLALPKNEESK